MADEQPVPPAETTPSGTTEPAPAVARDAAALGGAAGSQAEPAPATASGQPQAGAAGCAARSRAEPAPATASGQPQATGEGAATALPGGASATEPGAPDLAAKRANQPAASARPEVADPTASNGAPAEEPTPAQPMPVERTPAQPMPPADIAPAV